MNGILENLELEVDIEEGGWQCFITGRRFIAKINGEPLCWAGEIEPEVLEKWGIEMPVSALEMDIDLAFRLVLKDT